MYGCSSNFEDIINISLVSVKYVILRHPICSKIFIAQIKAMTELKYFTLKIYDMLF